MERKHWVDRAEAGDKMIFEGVNAAFSSVATMHALGSELIIHLLVLEEFLENLRALVVQLVE